MPPLPNLRHEEFAYAVAQHGVKSRAAIEAGYAAKNADVAAAKLMKTPGVRERIAELQERKAEIGIAGRRPKIDYKWAEEEALQNYMGARNDHAKFKWFEMLARMSGLLVDRSVNVNANINSNTSALESLPPEHMQALLAAVRTLRTAKSADSMQSIPASSVRVIEHDDVEPRDGADGEDSVE
jgi:hypothetical protein